MASAIEQAVLQSMRDDLPDEDLIYGGDTGYSSQADCVHSAYTLQQARQILALQDVSVDGALRLCEQAPDSAEQHYLKGICLTRTGMGEGVPQEALVEFLQAVAGDPGNPVYRELAASLPLDHMEEAMERRFGAVLQSLHNARSELQRL